MVSSAELSILLKLSDLVQRLGMRPSDANANILFVDEDEDPQGRGYYAIDFVGRPTDPELARRFAKLTSLIGIENGQIRSEALSDLEDIVDSALSRSPRPRVR